MSWRRTGTPRGDDPAAGSSVPPDEPLSLTDLPRPWDAAPSAPEPDLLESGGASAPARRRPRRRLELPAWTRLTDADPPAEAGADAAAAGADAAAAGAGAAGAGAGAGGGRMGWVRAVVGVGGSGGVGWRWLWLPGWCSVACSSTATTTGSSNSRSGTRSR
ncbi:hypothetical protein [Cryptosporangium sp. NPDC048952]|uniref:hypothetical protein n=1 Tax=Cryptosporangium sp. NPDC048952 TaxID=3363961 RepID=UPI00372038D8